MAYNLPLKSVLKEIKYQDSRPGKLYEGVYGRFYTDLLKQKENKSYIKIFIQNFML